MSTISSQAPAVLGDRLRELRRQVNMTQGDLAGNDYSVSYISAIERNKIRPSMRALAWLASRLGVQLADLLAGDLAQLAESSTLLVASENDIQVVLAQAQMDLADHSYQDARDRLLQIREAATLPSQRTILGLLLGEAYIGLNQANEAKEILELNLTLTREIDPEMHERSRNLLGVAFNRMAMHMLAAECHRQCLAAIDSNIIRDPSFELSVLNNLGSDYMQLGQYNDAITAFSRATTLGQRLQTPQAIARLYWEISEQYRMEGQIPQAQRYADMASEHLRAAANRQIFAQVQSSLGLAFAEQNMNEEAEQTLAQARELAERAGDFHGESVALASLSRVQLARGSHKVAEASARAALKSAETSKEPDALGRAYLALGEAQAALGQAEQADKSFEKGLDYLARSGAVAELTRAYERYADLLEQRGEVKRALEYMRRARQGIGAQR